MYVCLMCSLSVNGVNLYTKTLQYCCLNNSRVLLKSFSCLKCHRWLESDSVIRRIFIILFIVKHYVYYNLRLLLLRTEVSVMRKIISMKPLFNQVVI